MIQNIKQNVKNELHQTLSNVPNEIKAIHHWIHWKLEHSEGKERKLPVSPNGRRIDVHNPKNWLPLQEAIDKYNPQIHSGIGFVLDDSGYTGIDIDNCLETPHKASSLKKWAIPLLDQIRGHYSEISPSGNGLKVWLKGDKPDWFNRTKLPIGDGAIEIHNHQYFTVTGQVIDPGHSETDGQARLDGICQHLLDQHPELFQEQKPQPTSSPVSTKPATDINLQQRLEKARQARNGAEFTALFDRGEISQYDNDHSRADLALCQKLAFWLGRDEALIDEAFRQSSLYREKWEGRHSGGGDTYGQMTIAKAISLTSEVYTGKPKDTGSTTMGPPVLESSRANPQLIGDMDDTTSPTPTPQANLEGKIAQLMTSESDTFDLIRSEPGTGKTYDSMKAALQREKAGQRIIFAMPSRQRGHQLAEELAQLGGEATVIEGRNRDNCQQYSVVQISGQSGFNIGKNICGACPYRQDCLYFQQFEDVKPISIMPYESAIEHTSAKDGDKPRLQADVIVFDEHPERALVDCFQIDQQQLKQLNPTTPETIALKSLLQDLMGQSRQEGQPLKQWEQIQKATLSILEQYQQADDSRLARLGHQPEQILKTANGQIYDSASKVHGLEKTREELQRITPIWLARIATELRSILQAETDINHYLVISEQEIIFEKRRNINTTAKLIGLDAYGEEADYSLMFNRPVQVHQPPNQPQPNWDIHHVQVNTAKYKMRMWPDPAWQRLIDDLLLEKPFQKAVIYTHQEFTAQVESIVDGFNLKEDQQIKVDYFHKQRGENTYKDFDLIMILGQADPQEMGLVAKYRAFQPRDSFINDNKQAKPHRRKFQNPDLQHYKESKQYGELRQSAYRIRPSTTTHPLGNKLILVTAFDVPELTDVPRNKIRKTEPQQMKAFYARVKKAEERRTRLSDLIKDEISDLGFFVPSGEFRQALNQALSSFDRPEGRPNNNIEYIGRISEHFSCTDRTIRNDVNLVIEDFDLPRHKVSVGLDGKSWTLTVYGDLERWEQAVRWLTPPLEPAEVNTASEQHTIPPPSVSIDQPMDAEQDTKTTASTELPEWWSEPGFDRSDRLEAIKEAESYTQRSNGVDRVTVYTVNPQIPSMRVCPALLIDTSEISPDDWDKPALLNLETATLQAYYPELGWSKVGTVVGVYEEAREKARQDRDWMRKAVYLGEVIRDSIEAKSVF